MINKDVNVRTSLTQPKDLKYKVEVLAKNEKRSVNKLINSFFTHSPPQSLHIYSSI